jgi:non-ribosomal peptide synthetase component F
MVHQPETLINQLVFLTEEEQNKLLTWSVGEYFPLPSNTITDLFEQSVKRAPNKPAIYLDDQFITYHQLWQKAEKITALIHSLNLPPQSSIGLCVPQGMELVALILGVAKAGCISVPLNRDHAVKHIDSLDQEVKLSIIISSEHSFESLSRNTSLPLYKTQELFANSTPYSPSNHSLPHHEMIILVDATHEGSYEKLSQKNMINYGFWFNRTTHFTAQSILDLSSPLSFNVLLPCLLAPLIAGGALAIGTVTPQSHAKNYLSYLQQQKISHLRLTTENWERLMTYPGEIRQLNELNHLLLTSDVEPIEKVSEWLSFCPASRFIILPEVRFQ